MSALAKASGALKSVDYEVFGRVQGVCFRMYTEDEARKMGVVGWVKNTRQGTVTGQVQGPEDKVNAIIFSTFFFRPQSHILLCLYTLHVLQIKVFDKYCKRKGKKEMHTSSSGLTI
ncbi:acylphosphatase-2 isoform X1 [Chelonia mydas]|uniref:acylphosphatase-2 isoform X1 n=1 Tax=Chelonia mydas TaxID=8469 RepID=UPI001CA9F584|nr:acylphosphatase-2 isoform X1 [Chelonia mydas]